ncbi:MAG: hypothetical protein NTY16_07060 [Deltaproteobacteria bacterium]|nr:hypothetical protein [Deltaproteobacteria bacterium]
MKIDNQHERSFNVQTDSVGNILDTLSGPNDRLWPRENWPPMLFDANLKPGAKGGHGPVRYYVDEYVPGRRAIFRFDGTGLTAGLDGRHLPWIAPSRLLREGFPGPPAGVPGCVLYVGSWLKNAGRQNKPLNFRAVRNG